MLDTDIRLHKVNLHKILSAPTGPENAMPGLYGRNQKEKAIRNLLATYDPDTPENSGALKKLISMHYDCKVDTLETLIDELKVRPKAHIGVLGSGFGSELVALSERKFRATGYEYQPSKAEVSLQVVEKLTPDAEVSVVTGDFLKADMPDTLYDGWMSVLVLVHIEDKKAALQKMYDSLKPGGKIVIEDFYEMKSQPLSEYKKQLLREKVWCNSMTTLDEWFALIKNTGFRWKFEEMTNQFKSYVNTRAKTYKKQDNQDPETAAFFDAMVELFDEHKRSKGEGSLGGMRVVLTKSYNSVV